MIVVGITGAVAFAMVWLAHRPVRVRRTPISKLGLPGDRVWRTK